MLSRVLQATGKCYSLVKATSISKPFEAEFPAPHLEQSKAIMDCVQQIPQDWFWRTLLSDQDIWDTSYPASDRSAKTIFSTWIMALTVNVSGIGEMMSDTVGSTSELEFQITKLQKNVKEYFIFSGNTESFESHDSHENASECDLSLDSMRAYIMKAAYRLLSKPWNDMVKTDMYVILSRVLSSLNVHMDHRLLFVTFNQQHGKGPSSTRCGDEVWLLGGAKVPYILRPLGDSEYELVGEAYIHGIMQGEAWDNGEESLTTLTLM
jgi:hypothetical protein